MTVRSLVGRATGLSSEPQHSLEIVASLHMDYLVAVLPLSICDQSPAALCNASNELLSPSYPRIDS